LNSLHSFRSSSELFPQTIEPSERCRATPSEVKSGVMRRDILLNRTASRLGVLVRFVGCSVSTSRKQSRCVTDTAQLPAKMCTNFLVRISSRLTQRNKRYLFACHRKNQQANTTQPQRTDDQTLPRCSMGEKRKRDARVDFSALKKNTPVGGCTHHTREFGIGRTPSLSLFPRDELHFRCAGRRFSSVSPSSGAIDSGMTWSTVFAPV
jgi:hypothetical protein